MLITILNNMYSQTIITTVIATIVTMIISNILKIVGTIKISRNSTVLIKYYKYELNDLKEIQYKVNTRQYDCFSLSFNLLCYNNSNSTKQLYNIHYCYHIINDVIDDKNLAYECITLHPKESVSLKFDVFYKKNYSGYLYNRKHYIRYQDINGRYHNLKIPNKCIQRLPIKLSEETSAILKVNTDNNVKRN